MSQKLSSIVNPENYKGLTEKLSDMCNRPLAVLSIEVVYGQIGEYVIFDCLEAFGTDIKRVSTGSKPMVQMLKDIDEATKFKEPVIMMFRQSGRSYTAHDASMPATFDIDAALNPLKDKAEQESLF